MGSHRPALALRVQALQRHAGPLQRPVTPGNPWLVIRRQPHFKGILEAFTIWHEGLVSDPRRGGRKMERWGKKRGQTAQTETSHGPLLFFFPIHYFLICHLLLWIIIIILVSISSATTMIYMYLKVGS
jgi:hypothetical protein